ncbi:MAG TPA: hypothetical protein DCX06_01080 [Opitutae bacterium]|nr:hypothetical protein [Opitutae bacterium]
MALSVQSKRCGFFGDLATALNGIRFAERVRIDCAVNWDKRSLYFDSEAGPNVWDYCFAQSNFNSNQSRGPIRFSLPYYPTASGFIPYSGSSERESLSHAISKFCKPHRFIEERVENYMEAQFAPRTLGVHYRGTDASAGFEGRRSVGFPEVEHTISKWLKQNRDGNVFLATDSHEAVERLSSRFPGAIHWQDCLRSHNENSLHGHYDRGNDSSGLKKAIDVYTDAVLLSQCSLVYADGSRVIWFAAAKNLNLEVRNFESDVS